MSELVVTILRLSYLILLWLLVLSAIGVLRRDVFGTRVVRRKPRTTGTAAPPAGRAAVVGQPGPPPRARTSAAGAGVGVAVAPAPASPRQEGARLLVTEGALRGTTVPLSPSSSVLIGRGSTCTLVLTDDYASTRHARIFPHHDGWWVEDLGSTNGTFVDGERIDAPRELRPGTPVRIGQTVLELQG